MKWLVLSLFLCFQPFLPARATKPALRALIACDMTSHNIRRGSRADRIRMKKTCQIIAKQLGIKAKITVLHGKKFGIKHVSRWINAIPSHCKDILFFYYSGHGGRYRSLKDPWPFMIFPLYHRPQKAKPLMGASVYQLLAKKSARLAIILFDSCNRYFQKKSADLPSPQMTLSLSPTQALPGLQTLFLKTRGIITSCAAQPGESAITTVRGQILGGIFTTGFLLSMAHVATQPVATWEQVFAETVLYCHNYCDGRQTPVYSIETR